MAVIRGETCFEKNAFEDTENLHPPTNTQLPVKEYLGKYSRYRKKNLFILKLFLRPILFHGKLSFDNLTYFKLYGNLNCYTKRTCLHLCYKKIDVDELALAERDNNDLLAIYIFEQGVAKRSRSFYEVLN